MSSTFVCPELKTAVLSQILKIVLSLKAFAFNCARVENIGRLGQRINRSYRKLLKTEEYQVKS